MNDQVDQGTEAYLEQQTQPPLREQFTTEEMIEGYIKLRELVKSRQAALDEELKPHKKLMQDIEQELSLILDEAGGRGLSTPKGSATYRNYRSVKVVDRMALDDFTKKTGNVDVYESRVSNEKILSLVESTGGLPPGVELSEYNKVIVTAPRSR